MSDGGEQDETGGIEMTMTIKAPCGCALDITASVDTAELPNMGDIGQFMGALYVDLRDQFAEFQRNHVASHAAVATTQH